MKQPLLSAVVLLAGWSALNACTATAANDLAGPLAQAKQENQAAGQLRPEPKVDDTFAWLPLFNGKDLTGWRTVNGTKGHQAKFHVEDGHLVGTNLPQCGGNCFLRTEQGYSDFVFTCDFKWDVPGNSGVQIRSHQDAFGEGAWDGRLWGYQVEMDPSKRAWTAGLQEEGGPRRRGWLVPLKGDPMAAARNAIKPEDWNRITVRAIGPRVETWLNGVPCVDYVETKITPESSAGCFALQIHYGHPSQMRWRNLKVLPLGPVAPVAFPVPNPQEKK